VSGSTTPNFGLALPTVGASRDTWGSLLNQNTTTIDTFLAYAMPIGAILDFAGPNAPPGFLICDGRLISRVTYAALFAVISTYWGAGDGSTTFALPPTPGRSSVGPGTVTDVNGNTSGFSFAEITGFLQQNISQANLPAISLMSDGVPNHSHTGATAVGGNHTHSIDQQGNHIHTTDVQGAHSHSYRYPSFSGGGPFPQTGGVASVDVSLQTDIQGAHGHNLSTAGLHAHTAGYSGNLQLGIYADGAHQHGVSLGGSNSPFWVLNPVLVCTKIIYAGSQAATTALAASPQRQRLSAPLRGGVPMRRLTAA
jgi:microcystin-dependent protein